MRKAARTTRTERGPAPITDAPGSAPGRVGGKGLVPAAHLRAGVEQVDDLDVLMPPPAWGFGTDIPRGRCTESLCRDRVHPSRFGRALCLLAAFAERVRRSRAHNPADAGSTPASAI